MHVFFITISIDLFQWCIIFLGNQWNTSNLVKNGYIRVLSDTYVCYMSLESVYTLESLISYIEHYSPMHLQNSAHETPNLLHWSFAGNFSFQLQVTVHIYDGVAIRLLGSNTESIEFQLCFTAPKLVSVTEIRFEEIKLT